MVLYYNQQSVPIIDKSDPSLLPTSGIQKSKNILYTRDESSRDVYRENKGLLESLSSTIFGGTPELYSKMLEENFINLSTDEKLIFLYKTNLIQYKTHNNYLMIIMFLLIVIVFNLYFKKY
tara:strand:+ start:28966 stop:29328 length:363 start_codon:yes stop_codon:yes gene_type:complete